MSCPCLLVGATHSGAGKTSVTLGLARALRRQGLRVQCFKVGPDFLDPGYLALASGRPCYNLDGWMCGRDYVHQLYQRATQDADLALIEGVMGLFDGAEPDSDSGSSAEIAVWLQAPVLLMVSAQGLARSVAATVKGYCDFSGELQVAGVIANHCGSKRHQQIMSDALASAGLPVLLGALRRNSLPTLPSRHLGLVSATPDLLSPTLLERLADGVASQIDLTQLVDMARPPAFSAAHSVAPVPQEKRLRLALADDRAFHFYYPDNLHALENQGFSLERFSPIADAALPADCDALYLGGGYPEAYAGELAGNRSMIESVRHFAASGRAIYAECGGLIYLSRGLRLTDGSEHDFAGVVPAWARMLPRRKTLGYVEVELSHGCHWGAQGAILRGHEFHYSELRRDPLSSGRWPQAYEPRPRRQAVGTMDPGYCKDHLLASYVHLHFASHPQAVEHFFRFCQRAAQGATQ